MGETLEDLKDNDKFPTKKNPETDDKDPTPKSEKQTMPEAIRLRIEEAKKVISEYDGKTLSDELDKEATIGDLEKYLNVPNDKVAGAIADMIFQIQNKKRPLISLLNEEELQKRKNIIEGTEGQKGLLENTKNRLEDKFTIEDMEMFGIHMTDNEGFVTMKQKLISMMGTTKRNIEYYSALSQNDIREKTGNTYYKKRISGANTYDGSITINVGSMKNYEKDESFEADFRKTIFHELLHTVQKKGYDVLFNPEQGIAKEIYGEDKEAKGFFESMFSEGGSIGLANSISDIDNFDEYQATSVIGLNYLFYGKQEKVIPYGEIFSKLRFFGEITEKDKILLVDYLKKEFSKEPIQGYLELKKKEPTAQGEELKEITEKIYDKLLVMAGENSKENIFFNKVYPGRKGEETIKEFKELAIKKPEKIVMTML
ncbi:MAG: hypothetical protein NT085_01110 [candidate division SR1 bacterium]|nr:hypothetical protein [candidate division SR1 bacterium]